MLLRMRPRMRGLARFSTATERTPVDVANVKLAKPKKPGSWVGLAGLEKRVSGSLIADTLKEMADDTEFQATAKQLRVMGAAKMTLEEKKRRRRALQDRGAPDFVEHLATVAPVADSARRRSAKVLQLNVGLYCNQACNHCHVESSPERTESMSREVAQRCLELLAQSPQLTTLDITGGAPELNPQFEYLVREARSLRPDLEIIDRCNLTVLVEPGQEKLAAFLAEQKVRVVASLPCYSPKNVNQQRGRGVFDRSIAGLRILNEHGFGTTDYLGLDLVYNPLGAFLPPSQTELEKKYRVELASTFGVEFNQLFTITNMPIKRFADFLFRRGELEEYMTLLLNNFNDATLPELMCKDTVSVGYDGSVYDCDFNQQLGLSMFTGAEKKKATTVFDIGCTDDLLDVPIAFDNHCYGCTAGSGSS